MKNQTGVHKSRHAAQRREAAHHAIFGRSGMIIHLGGRTSHSGPIWRESGAVVHGLCLDALEAGMGYPNSYINVGTYENVGPFFGESGVASPQCDHRVTYHAPQSAAPYTLTFPPPIFKTFP